MKIEEYLEIVIRYMLILIVVLLLKMILTSNITMADTYEVVYSGVTVNGTDYERPHFNNVYLNQYTDTYITENSCEYLNYHIFTLEKNMVNLFVDCGNPKSVLYNYKTGEITNYADIIKNTDEFNKSVTNLLNIKYPKFVTENIDNQSAVYDLYDNEIKAYYKTSEYGNVAIIINNNEIKDLMTYNMAYDAEYTNETYEQDDKKLIAFSFDDGPSNYDLELLTYLNDAHATATFFMVGNRLNNFKDVVLTLATSNMEIGNHTYDHKSMTKLTTEKMTEEITKTNTLYNEITGKELTLFRPSYGSINKNVLLNTNMPVILWSIDTEDWKSRDADKVLEKILENPQDGDIVLMHSLYKSTVDAVGKALPELYKRGFRVVSIGELMSSKNKTIVAGSSYRSAK